MGIEGTALDWFASYLAERSQVVEVNGVTSEPLLLDAMSIIQGSTLGPILFNIYINDLPLSTKLFISMFADDTTALD